MTSRFGRTIRRSRMRCRKCPSGSGKWGSPRRTCSKNRDRPNEWPSRALERHPLDEPGQIRPRFAVRARDRLQGRRVVHVRVDALHDSFLERGDVFALEEHPDRCSIPCINSETRCLMSYECPRPTQVAPAARASQIGFTASLMFGCARDFVWTPSLRVGAACPFVRPYTPLSWITYNMSRFRRPAFTK